MEKHSKYRKWAVLGVLAGTLVLSGCSSLRLTAMDELLKREPPCNCINDPGKEGKLYSRTGGDVELDLEGFLKDAKRNGTTAGDVLDTFLNCTVADLGEKADENLKVYRGYVALAVLTRYAAFNYTGYVGGAADLNFKTYNGIQEDAMSTLSRIDLADKMLRMGSGIAKVQETVDVSDANANRTLVYLKQIAPQELGTIGRLHDVEKLHRALAVLMVASSAEKPTVARARMWLSNIVAAIDGSLTNPGSLVDQGLKVIGKSLTLTTYGGAYLDAARCELESMAAAGCKKPDGKCLTPCSTCPTCTIAAKDVPRDGAGQKPPRPTDADWNYWANIIKDSCTAIAASTGATSHCAGGWIKAAKPAPNGGG